MQAYRAATYRNERIRRGSVTHLFCNELPLFSLGSSQGTCGAPRKVLAEYCAGSPRARPSLSRTISPAGCDRLPPGPAAGGREGQLGDILHSQTTVQINTFGSMMDPFLSGQVVTPSEIRTRPVRADNNPVGLNPLLTEFSANRPTAAGIPSVLRPIGDNKQACAPPCRPRIPIPDLRPWLPGLPISDSWPSRSSRPGSPTAWISKQTCCHTI